MPLALHNTPRWLLFLLMAAGITLLLFTASYYIGDEFRGVISRFTESYFERVRKVAPMMLGSFGAAIAILLIEWRQVGWKDSSLASLMRPSRSALNDVFLWLVALSQVAMIFFYMITFNLFIEVRPIIREALGMDRPFLKIIDNRIIQLILYVFIFDFVGYMHHYLSHRIPQFWVFHKVHHSATEFTTITSARGHPIEVNIIAEMSFCIPLAIMGFPVVDMAALVVFRQLSVFMHHSRLSWDWGWFGKYVFVSPQYHRLHHSMQARHFNKNLAVLFPIWDHMFGTYSDDTVELTQLGLDENGYNKKGILSDLWLPFKEFGQTITGYFNSSRKA